MWPQTLKLSKPHLSGPYYVFVCIARARGICHGCSSSTLWRHAGSLANAAVADEGVRGSVDQAFPSAQGRCSFGNPRAPALSPGLLRRRVSHCRAPDREALLVPIGCRLSRDWRHLSNGVKFRVPRSLPHSERYQHPPKNPERRRRSPIRVLKPCQGSVFLSSSFPVFRKLTKSSSYHS
jgi:hypothetical protein